MRTYGWRNRGDSAFDGHEACLATQRSCRTNPARGKRHSGLPDRSGGAAASIDETGNIAQETASACTYDLISARLAARWPIVFADCLWTGKAGRWARACLLPI